MLYDILCVVNSLLSKRSNELLWLVSMPPHSLILTHIQECDWIMGCYSRLAVRGGVWKDEVVTEFGDILCCGSFSVCFLVTTV